MNVYLILLIFKEFVFVTPPIPFSNSLSYKATQKLKLTVLVSFSLASDSEQGWKSSTNEARRTFWDEGDNQY